ncbi:MAG: 4-alpha-glucanotransferase [Deltaproteobacteria bacterium]|nr:4-alpha-glucanotransferase [Deltaproteobacteria bacterium]
MNTLTRERRSGILLHPTALPGPYGIGDLGSGARRFVDWLAAAQQRLWQVLPLNPTSHGNSPYTSPSAFAGNTRLLSLEGLLQDGLLGLGDINGLPPFPRDHVDFAMVHDHRTALFARVHDAFRAGKGAALRPAFDEFRHAQQHWLEDHALFAALHRHFNHLSWPQWDRPIARHEKKALETWRDTLHAEVERESLLQFLFYRQWDALRGYAHDQGIQVVGDAPIFVAFDSADCWASPHQFRLDENGERTVVAGVPPDYFSKDGQLWGNPHYDWDAMAQDGYAWWVARTRAVARQVDIIRIDHFRGFAAAWEVKATEKTARKGRWVKGPGRQVFDAIRAALGEVPFIAEDLGVITPDVEALRDGLGLPGMRVLQFAFGDEDGINAFLPHNHVPATVVYTGTHDNDTTRGWWDALDDRTRMHVMRYLGVDGRDIAWDLVRAAWRSCGAIAVAPVQDVLDLGTHARFNTPGKAEDNWGWRLADDALGDALAGRLAELTTLTARHARAEEKRRAQAALAERDLAVAG